MHFAWAIKIDGVAVEFVEHLYEAEARLDELRAMPGDHEYKFQIVMYDAEKGRYVPV